MGNSSASVGGIGLSTIVFTVLAYFVYGKSIAAMFGMLLLVIGSGFTTVLSFIPFIGAFLEYYVNSNFTYPLIMHFVDLSPTWLTTILFIVHTIFGAIITIIISLVVLAGIIKNL